MSVEKFREIVKDFQDQAGYREPLGFGICRLDRGVHKAKTLQATYPVLNWQGENLGAFAAFSLAASKGALLSEQESERVVGVTPGFIDKALEIFQPFLAESLQDSSKHKNIQVLLELQRAQKEGRLADSAGHPLFCFVVLCDDAPCASVESAYMKLLALSLGKAPLRSLVFDGIFGLLDNVAWSGNRPYELSWLREHEIALKMRGEFPVIDYIDKFPRYLMQVVPEVDNIRLLDTAKTRFGAYLGRGGYTQMPGASYVNFNAGVEGACMNEGRISSSVIVGEGSDIGGGASILGVLSGGNSTPISIGKNCLLGVNSSTGISLGDGCIVDGGIAVLAGTVFRVSEAEARKIQEVNPSFEIRAEGFYKGREFSGCHGIHFRQDSKSGAMSAFRSSRKIELNSALH